MPVLFNKGTKLVKTNPMLPLLHEILDQFDISCLDPLTLLFDLFDISYFLLWSLHHVFCYLYISEKVAKQPTLSYFHGQPSPAGKNSGGYPFDRPS